MQKIVTHLWFDTQAKGASEFYVSLLPDSKVDSVNVIKDTPSGDCDIVHFTLAWQKFMAISAGPYFKFNPSISLFVVFENEQDITAVWDKLIEGGKALMPFDTYPWAQKYGWVQDRFGLTWQLSLSEHHKFPQRVTPLLMYTQGMAGQAQEAVEFYATVFPESNVEMLVPYEEGEGDVAGYIKHARFSLLGQNFMAMDSSGPHAFVFNEAVSFIVNCETQEEIDCYWEQLSAVPQAEQCGWLKDKFGVSWQIVPTAMNEMMGKGTPEQKARLTQAVLKMKKFNIAELQKAYSGE
ncbi:MAG: VOC family protein [Candidatus Doudnabacteria bacterium]|nr:VOC family protein [Candidatus Doudnabacteria bacterium]